MSQNFSQLNSEQFLKLIAAKERIEVIVRPGSQEEGAFFDSERNSIIIFLKERAESGKANKALIRFFAKHFNKKAEIVSGHSSRRKILKITEL